MKKVKLYIVVLSLVLGTVLFGCASHSNAATDKTAETVTKAEETVDDEDESGDEADALEFTAVKKKIKCGKSFQFETNREDVTWSVSNKAKATISKTGKLKAKRYGKVRVTATSGDESVSYVVKLLPKQVIGIDPGHQLRGNSGTEPIGPSSSTKKAKVAGGTSGVSTKKPEYQLTLEIGLALKEELKNRGYKVVMTREKNDIDITNIERAQKLNEKCDVAIRLHADGAASSVRGASVLYPSADNPYVASLSEASGRLSKCVIDAYCAATGIGNRGLSLRDDLTGTNWSTIPVTLLEMGFMTNSSDDSYMSSAEGQAAMVQGIADGIDAYFGY
ncbi:MAG: N-acetylmuramoyl-L-alanine amidase [Lachnospiraceae bacterium]|nr:N-acetylmuramoyl-L-alanine amidase [Lachnospiraceae bacterium]